MPKQYDRPDRFRWTHRCQQIHMDWEAKRLKYPFAQMQVGDFISVEGEPLSMRLRNAMERWRRNPSYIGRMEKEFTIRPVKGLPDVYVCRRVK